METIRSWKQSLLKTSFVYQYILEKYKNSLNNCLLVMLIINSLNAIISGITTTTLTVDDAIYKKITLGFNVSILFFNLVNLIAIGYVKQYDLDKMVEKLSIYIQKIDGLYYKVSGKLILPDNLRGDIDTFIEKENEYYLELVNDSPDVPNSYYVEGNKEYLEYLENETKYHQFFDKIKDKDGVIQVI